MRMLARLSPLLFLALILLQPCPSWRQLARRDALYIENGGTNRAIAALSARLVEAGDAARLQLRISALDPRLDPEPGFEGRRGANRIAARELTAILGDGRAAVRTAGRADRAPRSGAVHASRRGRVPVRRIVGGRLVWDGQSSAEYVLEMHADSGPVPAGEHCTELWIEDVPRLRVRFTHAAGTGRILDLESLDDHPLRPLRP